MASVVASPVAPPAVIDSAVEKKDPLAPTIPSAIHIESAYSKNNPELDPKHEAQSHHPSQTDNIGLTTTTTITTPTPEPNHLITSPYTTPEHQLDLSTLDTPNRLLAQALAVLEPTRPDYATAPYIDSFDWPGVVSKLQSLAAEENFSWQRTSFYVVAFRSILRADADGDRLHLLDERSHAEAVKSGGLLKYWFGSKNERRENLATCVWRSREDARAGGTGPWHAQARGAARTMYEKIEFTTMELVVREEEGEWELKAWRD
ncbi:uncharacterized protein BDV14DRAFT_166269 [Aspergillus stella-maris]|uniref:uncharacterized protein n=1 Tax=Aspergillus stella-maris TaxID=1810926 RepID=UPI003CCE01E9